MMANDLARLTSTNPEFSFKDKLTPTLSGDVIRFPLPKAPSSPSIIVPGGGFEFIAVGDAEYSEPEYVIEDLIEADSLASCFGDPGHGKSFFAIDLACCVATGTEFHGKEVRQGAVFYIAGEGHNGLLRRFNAWSKHHETPIKGAPLYTSKRAANFLDAAHAETVGKAVDSLAVACGSPQLIVVDTLARNFGDGDENNTADMNSFVAAMDDLRSRYPGSTVLVVHHTGHAEKGRSRGSMAFKGALDAEYQVAKSDGVVTIKCTKMKEADLPADISFKLEGVDLGTDSKGKTFGSAVLVPCDAPAAKAGKLSAGKRLGLETFQLAARDSGAERDGPFRGVHVEDWRAAYYQKSTAENPDTKRRNFNKARRDLTDEDYLTVNNDLYQIGKNYPYDAGELI